MTPTRQSLVEHFALLSDEELLEQFRAGGFTELAQEVAAAELRSRNLDVPQARPPQPATEPEPEPEPESAANAGWSREDMVPIAHLTSVNASLLQSRLNAEGVPAVITDDFASRNIPFGVGIDGVRVLVPQSYLERAVEIRKKIDRGDYALDDKSDGE